ncbi:hypothetical protein Tco_0181918, partial [Tanacetum coccineum]
MDAQTQGRQECNKEKEESREECSKSRKTKKMKLLNQSVNTAKPTVSTARRKQFVLLKITTASTKSITVVGEKVNAAESLLVASTEVNAN